MPARRIGMAKTQRGSSRKRSSATDEQAAAGTGGFLGQVGLFESANGLPHGPAAIALAIGAAILIYPVARLIRAVRGR
jgi:hypothetical protein